jgi:predicted RNA-binding protein YlqC (UPF0109 family)
MADVRELIEHIVRALVADPSQVQLTESRDDDTIVYTIRAASDELGRVIGKQGRVVNAIQRLAEVAHRMRGKRIRLEITERISDD